MIIFGVLYAVAGVVLAFIALRRGTEWAHVLLVIPLWPLMAPSVLVTKNGFDDRALTSAEREAVKRFREHLATRTTQLEAIMKLRADSKGRLDEPLDRMETKLRTELDAGRALLDELADRIALAQVAALGAAGSSAPERLRLEELIARADALVAETA